jgi:hypothetical protein
MRTKKLLVLALTLFAIAGATLTLADYVEIDRNPPPPSQCVCPAVWDPVVCRGPDGSVRTFSNACVAGCNGYTKCVRYAVSE